MVYLDHAATTPMVPQAVQAMTDVLSAVGNPSSLHAGGRRARRLVEESRERIAAALGARPSEVLFTAGGTESDNLALKGLYWARRGADARRTRVLTSAVEHHAVLDTVVWLADHEGADVVWLDVDDAGRVDPGLVDRELAAHPGETALVSVQWANNEVGTIEPVAEIAGIAARHGVPMHTDAVQAAGILPIDFGGSALAALTATGHKLGGPMGIGVLLLDRGAECTPLLHGGGQERDVHSGTLNTAAIVSFATALDVAVAAREQEARRLVELREELARRITDVVPDAVINGDRTDRLPGNLHVSFPGCEGDALLMLLDARGIECSTGSACMAGVARASHVLLAMGADHARARGSLRFSLGHTSTPADIDALAEVIAPAVERARRAGLGAAS